MAAVREEHARICEDVLRVPGNRVLADHQELEEISWFVFPMTRGWVPAPLAE